MVALEQGDHAMPFGPGHVKVLEVAVEGAVQGVGIRDGRDSRGGWRGVRGGRWKEAVRGGGSEARAMLLAGRLGVGGGVGGSSKRRRGG